MEQDRTAEAIELLKESTSDPQLFRDLTGNFQTFKDLVEKLGKDQSVLDVKDFANFGTIEKFQKTSLYLDEQIKQ